MWNLPQHPSKFLIKLDIIHKHPLRSILWSIMKNMPIQRMKALFWTLSAILPTDHNKAFGQIFNYSAIFSSIRPSATLRVHLLRPIFSKGMAFPKIVRPSRSSDNRFRIEGKAFLPFIRPESKHFLIKRISNLRKQDLCWLTSLCLRIQFICAIKFVHFSRLPRCERPINITKSDQPIILCCRLFPRSLSRNHHSK